jgi:CheY-like chemotaxis protein
MNPLNHIPTILLVEDNDDDVFFMRHALQKAKVGLPVQVVPNGQAALDYLSGEGRYADREKYPLPTLIFLDLKMPYVNGFEVLAWMQRQTFTPEIQVVVLTSSPEDRDRQRAKELGARAYLVKPPTEEMILQTMHFIMVRPILVPAREVMEARAA